ncbi:MAG: trigger factor [Bacteroidetes bacterium]|nr:trigger factor [Bacteroidota bacterium]
MATVVREDIDKLNATLTVKLAADEYKPTVQDELKKLRSKVTMKGFRKGKTPMSMVRKMYGPGILSDVIDKEVNKAMTDYLVKEKLSFLGNPIPSEEQKDFDFDVNDLQDFEIAFDLGLVPEFELAGLDEKTKFPKYAVKVDKKTIDKELNNMLKRLGTQEATEEEIEEDDILRLTAKELDGRKLKEDGHETNFSVAVKDLSKDAAKKVTGKKVGVSFNFDIFELEEKANRENVINNMLQLTDDTPDVGDKYKFTVDEVIRLKPAEPTEENLVQLFGPDRAKTEEEARAAIEEDISKYFDNQADGILFKQVQKHLLESNEKTIPLPDNFLKRWLVSRNQENDLSVEEIEKDYPMFSEDLRWRLIKEKLMEKFDIKIEENDIRDAFRQQFSQYLGAMGAGNEELIEGTIDRAMQSQDQVERVQQEVITEKVFESLKEVYKLEKKSVKEDKFEELQKEYLQRNQG